VLTLITYKSATSSAKFSHASDCGFLTCIQCLQITETRNTLANAISPLSQLQYVLWITRP